MSESQNKPKTNDITVSKNIRDKIKTYFYDRDMKKVNIGKAPIFFVKSLITVLEELICNCIENTTKNKINGLYTINMLVLRDVLNLPKYYFFNKYVKQYSNIEYADNLYFNFAKSLKDIEARNGDKLSVDLETKKYLCFLISNIQYEILSISQKILVYSDKVTLNKDVIDFAYNCIVSKELSNKIKLKLDCISEAEIVAVDEDDIDADVNVDADADADAILDELNKTN